MTGLTLLFVLAATFAALYVFQHAGTVLESQTTIRSDFSTIAGLRDGSPVQLAGVEIGKVSSVDFVKVQYTCEPRTEDIGRDREGRTDDCDERLFCSQVGLCADLERMASLGDHTRCIESADCREDEVCITSDFTQRERHVVWAGPEGVCVQYNTRHLRVRVEMDVPNEMMELIRRDSRTLIASNSVLGDQLINISPGFGEPLDIGFQVQSRRSLYEDINNWRQRLHRVTENVEVAMSAIADIFAELRDPRWLGAVRGVAQNLEKISGSIMRREGLIGALIGGPTLKRDVALMLRGIRNATAGIADIVTTLNRLLNTVSRNVDPVLAETKALSRGMRALLADIKDPDNRSLVAVLMVNRSAELTADLEVMIAETEGIVHALEGISGSIDRAEGTVGKLLDDPKVGSDLARLLDRLEDHGGTAALLRWW
ncbi:MAG: MCE family protein, partial [Nannocystaceae bacterium]|nr:MCE family protein [Nannocystaceae bacterium]